MQKYLKTAIKLAYSHVYDDCLEYRLCAVIARGGNVVSVGYNKRQTNGFVEYYADLVKGQDRDYNMSTHAEMDAVLSVRAKTDLRGCKIYVARIRPPKSLSDGKIGMSRPCAVCQAVLHSYGITRAYYTIDDNNYGVMKIVQGGAPKYDQESDRAFFVGGE